MGDPSGLEHGGCRLSPGFANLVRNIEERYGYHLRVIPTREWLVYGSSQDHLFAALAFYETWKNKQKDQPVNLSLMDEEGRRYISISDAASGPSLTAYHSEEIKQERHAV